MRRALRTRSRGSVSCTSIGYEKLSHEGAKVKQKREAWEGPGDGEKQSWQLREVHRERQEEEEEEKEEEEEEGVEPHLGGVEQLTVIDAHGGVVGL